jgi:hypothetical protein
VAARTASVVEERCDASRRPHRADDDVNTIAAELTRSAITSRTSIGGSVRPKKDEIGCVWRSSAERDELAARAFPRGV